MQQAIPKLETRRPLFQRFFLRLGWIRFPFGFARCSGTRHSLRCFPGVLCACFFQKGIYKGIFYFFVCTHNGILYRLISLHNRFAKFAGLHPQHAGGIGVFLLKTVYKGVFHLPIGSDNLVSQLTSL